MIRSKPIAAAALLACCQFALAAATPAATERQATPLKPCQSLTTDEPTTLMLGKSRVVALPFPAVRMVVGGQAGSRVTAPVPAVGVAKGASAAAAAADRGSDGVAETDITLISPTELYFLGRRPGSMNVVVQAVDGRCLVKDINVTMDPGALQATLADLLPEEKGVRVRATQGALVLSGTVPDNATLDEVMAIAGPYSGKQRKVINLLKVASPQQVMLEVKIAEVSKAVLGHLNFDFSRMVTSANGAASSVISGILGGGAAVLGRFEPNVAGGGINNSVAGLTGGATAAGSSALSSVSRGSTLLGIDAQNKDGLVRVLAEPNIMAVSGQQASFLSGGKIFIPVAQNTSGGTGSAITLEEKEFGVGLKFTPTVLGGSRINLKLVSEASELQQTGSPFTTVNGTTAILPSLSTRRVDTTVQLHDGESFMVAGLIKNNVSGALEKFPGLGDVPVMGSLFRSTEFQNDRTELMFIVTPHLVKPLKDVPTLPTDNHIAPTRDDVVYRGQAEGVPPLLAAPQPPAQAPAQPQQPAPAQQPAAAQPPQRP
ncbi:MAG: type II and III secretion system protein family protein [Burkholderiales bacterium]|nr:type II and III secretion system protein family protein [Burkholderiales bacterium]